MDQPEQAKNWFHPRLRSAENTFDLRFKPGNDGQIEVEFAAKLASDQARVENLAKMFDLDEFWGQKLSDEVQLVAAELEDELSAEGIAPTIAEIKTRILRMADRMKRRIGHDSLAIVKSYFYGHMAQSPSLMDQVLRTCQAQG